MRTFGGMSRTSVWWDVRGGNTSGGLDGRFFWGIDESLRQANGGYHYIGGAGGQALFNVAFYFIASKARLICLS